MAETVRIEGLRELDARLRKLADEVGSRKATGPVKSALRKAGNVVKKDAQRRVHVKSGTLRENIIVTASKKNNVTHEIGMDVTIRYKAKKYKDTKGNRKKGRVGGKYKNYGPLFYGRFLEFGTSKMPAYPFMRPAFESNKRQLPEIIKVSLAAAIDRAVKRMRK